MKAIHTSAEASESPKPDVMILVTLVCASIIRDQSPSSQLVDSLDRITGRERRGLCEPNQPAQEKGDSTIQISDRTALHPRTESR